LTEAEKNEAHKIYQSSQSAIKAVPGDFSSMKGRFLVWRAWHFPYSGCVWAYLAEKRYFLNHLSCLPLSPIISNLNRWS